MNRQVAIFLSLTLISGISFAEVYIYQGPDGERMISDRPAHPSDGYRLVTRRDSLDNAGHILAKRRIQTGGPVQFQHYINGASDRFNVDPALVEAVIQVESGFDPNAVSRKGATGLMQLMQQTAQQYHVRDRFNPRENIFAGVQHLSRLIRRFDGRLHLALAAYNAGSTAVELYRGVPPFPETQRFITKVTNYHTRYRASRYGTGG